MADTATTLTELRADRVEVRAALSRIRTMGQAVGSNGRQLTRADYAELRRELARLDSAIARLEGTGGMRRGVPI